MAEDRTTQLEQRVSELEKTVRMMPLRLLAAASVAAFLISVIVRFVLR
jgi:hypothetical protein